MSSNSRANHRPFQSSQRPGSLVSGSHSAGEITEEQRTLSKDVTERHGRTPPNTDLSSSSPAVLSPERRHGRMSNLLLSPFHVLGGNSVALYFLSFSWRRWMPDVTCSGCLAGGESGSWLVRCEKTWSYLHFWIFSLFLQLCCILFENKWPSHCLDLKKARPTKKIPRGCIISSCRRNSPKA